MAMSAGAFNANGQTTQTIDIENYFPLVQNSCWHYSGAGQAGSSAGDNFTWTILPDTLFLHGTNATQIETSTDNTSNTRNGDRDFWSVDDLGNLFYHGFHNANADGQGGPFVIESGDFVFDSAFLAGIRGMLVGQVFEQQATISNILIAHTGRFNIHAELREIIPTYNTPLGSFHDVARMVFTVTFDQISGPFISASNIGLRIRESEFYLVDGTGMIAHDMNADPGAARIQALDAGKINNVPIVGESVCDMQSAILNYLFGIENDPANLDLNGDMVEDVADLVTCANM